jgi:hypothetical protein
MEFGLWIDPLKATQKIPLISGQDMEGKTAAFSYQLMRIPVWVDCHHDHGRIIGDL